MEQVLVILLVVMIAVAVFVGWQKFVWLNTEGFQTVQTIGSVEFLSTRPTLWWVVDDDTNGRAWWDFGARNSHAPNRGYLQVAQEALYATQAIDFNIQPLIGRAAVSKAIIAGGGASPSDAEVRMLPATLWRQWALANLLSCRGGLVMMGDSTLCVGPSFTPVISNKRCAVFGISADEPRAVPGSEVAPAPWVGWAAGPHTATWDAAADVWNRLVAAGPTSWSAAEARKVAGKVWLLQRETGDIASVQVAEGGRWPTGVERTLEDFLMRTSDDTQLHAETVYVPMDGDRVVRDRRYAWFARMSRDQILAADFVWANLARRHLSRLLKV